MRGSKFLLRATLPCATLCALALFVTPARAEEKSPALLQYAALAKDFVQLRDMDAKKLGPQQILESAETLEGKLQKLVDSAASDPSAKSKAQELLAQVFSFDGKAPEARQMYSDYLSTLESWQGKNYAVMTVRRAGDRMLNECRNSAKAIEYYDLLLEKYPDHTSKTHVLYQSGLACIEAKAFDEAIRRFDLAVAAEPNGYYAPWALRKKAYVLYLNRPAEGSIDQTLAALDDLGTRYPTPHWEAYVCYRKGYCLASNEKYLEAMAEYSKGIAECPSSPYSEMGRKHIAMIQKILERDVLDKLAQERMKEGTAPPDLARAEVSRPVSVALSDADDRLGEGRQ